MKRNLFLILGVLVLAVGLIAVTSGKFCTTSGNDVVRAGLVGGSTDDCDYQKASKAEDCPYKKAIQKTAMMTGKEDCDPSQCDEAARAAHPECDYSKTKTVQASKSGCDYSRSKTTRTAQKTSATDSPALVKVE